MVKKYLKVISGLNVYKYYIYSHFLPYNFKAVIVHMYILSKVKFVYILCLDIYIEEGIRSQSSS